MRHRSRSRNTEPCGSVYNTRIGGCKRRLSARSVAGRLHSQIDLVRRRFDRLGDPQALGVPRLASIPLLPLVVRGWPAPATPSNPGKCVAAVPLVAGVERGVHQHHQPTIRLRVGRLAAAFESRRDVLGSTSCPTCAPTSASNPLPISFTCSKYAGMCCATANRRHGSPVALPVLDPKSAISWNSIVTREPNAESG